MPGARCLCGAPEGISRIHTEKHIFVADKGDHHDFADDVPQHEQ